MHGQRSYQEYYGLIEQLQEHQQEKHHSSWLLVSEAVILVEVGLSSLRRAYYDESSNNDELRLNLDCLSEVRDEAALRMAQCQQKMAKYHNQRVKFRRFNPIIWYHEKSHKPLETQPRGS